MSAGADWRKEWSHAAEAVSENACRALWEAATGWQIAGTRWAAVLVGAAVAAFAWGVLAYAEKGTRTRRERGSGKDEPSWWSVRGDSPVRGVNEDQLERSATAEQLAHICMSTDAAEGVSIGLVGEWGSGKTSCLNMTEETLKRHGYEVVRFDPWMWKGSGMLTCRLLEAMARRKAWRWSGKRRSLKELARVLAASTAASHRVGQAIEAGARRSAVEKAEALREKIKRELQEREKPLIVMLDDIDRLGPGECEESLRAVKQAGGLPNVVYVIALDKETVAGLISEEGFDGHEYLGKILQVEKGVPPLDAGSRMTILRRMLGRMPGVKERLAFEDSSNLGGFSLLYHELRELLRTPRELKRYGLRVEEALASLGDAALEVRMEDLLALEAIRMKCPGVAKVIETRTEAVTMFEGQWMLEEGEDEPAKEAGRLIAEAAGTDKEAVRAFVNAHLPRVRDAENERRKGSNEQARIRQLREEHRIGERSVMETALGRAMSGDVKLAWKARRLREALARPAELEGLMGGLEHSELAALMSEIASTPGSLEEEGRAAIPALMRKRGEVSFRWGDEHGASFVGVVVKLLEGVEEAEAAEEVRRVMEGLEGAAGIQARFVYVVRRTKERGRFAIEEAAIEEVEEDWLERLGEGGRVASLVGDREAFGAACLARVVSERTSREWRLPESPELTRQILQGARLVKAPYSTTGRTADGITTTRQTSDKLDWERLIQIWGSEEALIEAVRKAREGDVPEEEAEALELAWDYCAGKVDQLFEEETKTEIVVTFGDEAEAVIAGLAAEEGGTVGREEIVERALRRGHGDPSIGAVRGLVKGRPRYPHEHKARVKVNEAQSRMAQRTAEELEVKVEDVWTTTLAAGLDAMRKERGRKA